MWQPTGRCDPTEASNAMCAPAAPFAFPLCLRGFPQGSGFKSLGFRFRVQVQGLEFGEVWGCAGDEP